MPRFKIGTRGSPLALAQARETRARLIAAHGLGEDEVEIVPITTTGDRIRDRPLAEIGGKGLFTQELEDALFAGVIDMAVHSMKDMPAHLPPGLAIGALLPREDARDAFISPVAATIAALPIGARVGSSSVRRTAQLLRLRPDTQTVQFRGNVETRLRKLSEGVAQATFLAAAGLNRLGLSHVVTALVPMDVMLPAVAQGAIGIEIRSGNDSILEVVRGISDPTTEVVIRCERAFLATLDGSCRTPLAGNAILRDGQIHFRGQALTEDGKHSFDTTLVGSAADAEAIGCQAGEDLKARGGALIAFA